VGSEGDEERGGGGDGESGAGQSVGPEPRGEMASGEGAGQSADAADGEEDADHSRPDSDGVDEEDDLDCPHGGKEQVGGSGGNSHGAQPGVGSQVAGTVSDLGADREGSRRDPGWVEGPGRCRRYGEYPVWNNAPKSPAAKAAARPTGKVRVDVAAAMGTAATATAWPRFAAIMVARARCW
jgi:hypothetical protein